jgi:hypothetical protein
VKDKPALFNELACASDALGEYNDCAVKAAAVTTGKPYSEAHKALADCGRRKRKGVYMHQWRNAVAALGHTVEDVPLDRIYSKTLATVEGELRRKWPGIRFAIETAGHLSSFDGEVVQDWARGSRRKVKAVYQVTPALAGGGSSPQS